MIGTPQFTIAAAMQKMYPELITLIKKTESMDTGEKQYWFDTLHSMKEEQIDRLYDILATEKKKLEELEEKYQEEIRGLNDTPAKEWEKHFGINLEDTL